MEQRIRPNILWICTDQQRYDTIHALGHEAAKTPAIDRLIANGVGFDGAYCQSPVCTPSRASFLTGMYPSSVRGCVNGNDHWSEAAPIVTSLFAKTGYDCGLVGKLHLSASHGRVEQRPVNDGFRYFEWSHGPQDRWGDGNAYSRWLKTKGTTIEELTRTGHPIPAEFHHTRWCAEKSIEFIGENHQGKPWLLCMNTFDPHMPFDPPEEYLLHFNPEEMPQPAFRESDLAEQRLLSDVDFQTRPKTPEELRARELRAAYLAMIELIDHEVGRVVDFLRSQRELENTLVLFMSDHGEMLGDHGLLLKGCRFYEGLVRVPLVFSHPDIAAANPDVHGALVELTDVAPTLLDFAGIEKPSRMQGRSLLPVLTGRLPGAEHRQSVRCEYYSALNPRRPHVSELIERNDLRGSRATMIRDRRYKLSIYHGIDHGELYDLETDPCEYVNLWDDPAFLATKCRLMKLSFDQMADAIDLGPEQVALY